jgi:hypothetical protein
LGDAASIQDVFREYFATIHKWIPIVSQKRMTRNFDNPMWEAGQDLALLFLCMKLMTSRPQDAVYCLHNPIYACAKRFLALMEATGAVSLIVLQAALLITWYEYGQGKAYSSMNSYYFTQERGNLGAVSGAGWKNFKLLFCFNFLPALERAVKPRLSASTTKL